MKTWADSEEFKTFAEDWFNRVLPHMKETALVMTVAPEDGVADVKIAVEIGFSILLDKPLIVVAPEGRHVAERLLRIADHVITGDITTDAGREKIGKALERIMKQ